MADEAVMQDGEAQEPIEQKHEDVASEKPDTLSAAEVQAMIEKERKQWQSRFDKILAEKKSEETKAMTVEQQIEQMQRERQQERLEWSRREAKAQAQIDDELESALLSYASDDPDKIAEGARTVRTLIDNMTAEYKKQLDELQKQVKYTSPPVKGGGSTQGSAETKTEFTRDELSDPKVARIVMERKKAGENITIL